MFDIPMLLVDRSGPDNATLTASVFIYNQAFGPSRMWNTAAAASMILFLMCSVIAGGLFFIFRDKDAIALKKARKNQRKKLKGGAV